MLLRSNIFIIFFPFDVFIGLCGADEQPPFVLRVDGHRIVRGTEAQNAAGSTQFIGANTFASFNAGDGGLTTKIKLNPHENFLGFTQDFGIMASYIQGFDFTHHSIYFLSFGEYLPLMILL
jgi:hypothetical protein